MGFLKSTKGSIISDNFVLLESVGQLKTGQTVDVALYDDHLALTAPFTKIAPISLRYSQITDVYYGIQSEIVRKNKSPIARAVVGGLLFGGVGAVVGAVSGVEAKNKKVDKFVFIISYTASDGEEKFLAFEDTRLYKGPKLTKKLKELCGITVAAPAVITNL